MDMAAASFAAYRMNGTLYKQSQVYDDKNEKLINVTTNQTLLKEHFTGKKLLAITDQDRAAAVTAREFLIDYKTMATLQERRVGQFVNVLVERLNKPTLELRDCAMISYLPEIYSQSLVKSDRANKVQMLAYTSQHFGSVGERLDFTLNVIEVKFVHQFNCYHVFGYDNLDNCIGYFTSKDTCTVNGSYVGKVKAHIIDNYRNGARVTQFNYVKIG